MRLALATLLVLALPVSAEPLRLVSQEKHDYYQSFLPKTTSQSFEAIKAKPLTWYTEAEMPRAYQNSGGIHDPAYNIAAIKTHAPGGNANNEFPWQRPAGMHGSPEVANLKFVHLPAPIIWWSEQLPSRFTNDTPSIVWQYPTGTVFGELIFVKDERGYDYVCEVRVREKRPTGWHMNAYRPFPTADDFAAAVKRAYPAWEKDAGFQRWLTRETVQVVTLADRTDHTVKAFEAKRSALDELPALPSAVVRKLLTETPFRSVLGEAWVRVGDTEGYAPTTQAAFSIVPKGYQAGHIQVSNGSKACMECHKTALMEARHFGPDVEWYGRVRGTKDGGIFSFHIFEPRCISHNGTTIRPELRHALAGWLKQR